MPGSAGSGPRPLPTSLKRLRGNPGGRRLKGEEPAVSAGTPEMPKMLDERAAQEWNLIVSELKEHGILWKLDRALLARFCFTVSLAEKMEADIKNRGAAIEEPVLDRHGYVAGHRLKRNPSVTIALDAAKLAKSLAAELCISPAARTRLSIEPPKQEDEFDRYLREGRGIAERPT